MQDFTEKVWAELYRPKTADEYVFPNERMKEQFNEWKSEGVFPNLLLSGIQGTGKSTFARVLINEFDLQSTDVMFVDGSVHNKVDDVREKIIPFTKLAPMGTFKLVVIEEAHRMSNDAQSALFETIERTSDRARFIFTTNFPQKIQAPIISRCGGRYTFNEFNEDGVLGVIEKIIEEQELSMSDESINNVMDHIETFKPDIRAIISSIQNCVIGGEVAPPDSSIKSASIDQWEAIWEQESLSSNDVDALMEMVHLIDNVNYEAFYTSIYMKGLHHFKPNRGEAVVLISDFISKAIDPGSQGIQSIHMEALLHSLFGLGE